MVHNFQMNQQKTHTSYVLITNLQDYFNTEMINGTKLKTVMVNVEVGHHLHHQFINNDGVVKLEDGTTITGKVNLSKAVKPR